MPVIDGKLVPHTPLTEAEHMVDYLGHHHHIERRRHATERHAKPAVRRAALTIVQLGVPGISQHPAIVERLETSLAVTARYGHRSARRELQLLRSRQVRAEHAVPDAGRHARVAQGGLDTVLGHVRQRARQAADAILSSALATVSLEDDPDLQQLAVLQAADRMLHNQVLELVGETLNLGRAAGVATMEQPPEFAMRSEQLDKATCDACTRLHGEIVEVGSSSYYEYMPPAGCYGGGRCRGIYVYGDNRPQVRGPVTEPGPQPALNPVPPVELPRRRQAA